MLCATRTLPTFRDAYRRRHCIVPVDSFLRVEAIKGQKPKQPYAITMKDGGPFGLGEMQTYLLASQETSEAGLATNLALC